MKRIPQGRYSKEFREEAVKLVVVQDFSVPEASLRLDVPRSTINNWVRASKAGKLGSIGNNRRELSDTELELARLKRELAQVKMERDILKSRGIFREGVDIKYAIIEKLRLQYPVKALCNQMELSESGYYNWRSRPLSPRRQDDTHLKVVIKAAHKRTRETFGPGRLQQDIVKNEGVQVGVHRIKRLRKELGIRCRQKQKFKATTNSNHSLPVAPNLVDQKFAATAPDQIWLTDITYIRTGERWLYLAAHKDLFTGGIVGYALDKRMTKSLGMKSLFRAVAKRHPPAGLIHHSDRGRQYCSQSYWKLLKQFKMKASMSRKGNCYDNAPIESFWGTLKNELVYHRSYETREQAIRDITEYIEIFYNRQRIQKRLGYLSPTAYEKKYYEKLLAA